MLTASFSGSKECQQKMAATNGSVRYASVHTAVSTMAKSPNAIVFPVLFRYLIAVRYYGSVALQAST
jgi:hypothetical protein